MISIENNKNLYIADSESILKSLNFAKNLPKVENKSKIDFNFYWRVPRDFGRKQIMPIKSCIATQDLEKTNIKLWSNIDLTKNDFLKPYLDYIEFKIYDVNIEKKDTFVESKTDIMDDEKCWLGGDLFRILILHKYGGFYVDMDVILLRDFNPISNIEFMYQWGSSGTTINEPNIRSNGAIMHCFKKSQFSCDLLHTLLSTPADPNSTCWGTDLYNNVRNKNNNWNILPCSWFNTEWCLGIPLEPFKKNVNGNNSSELYDGAFSWHWHNKWDDEIEEGSKFYILENKINNILLEKGILKNV